MDTSTTTGRRTPGQRHTAGWMGRIAGGALRRGFLALWITLLGALAAPAAEFQTHRGDDLNILVVTGEIMPSDDDLFLAEVERATADGQHALVVLASDGGALGAGMHMGLVIREAGLATFVPEGERCASACALAWLAGEPRMTTARSEIGFHQPYDDSSGDMVASIEANAVVGHYIATIGMGPEVVSFAVSAPPDSMAWLTPVVADGLGLDIVEVAAERGGEAMAMLTERAPPIDEGIEPTPFVPAPLMRPLTAAEVASVSLTGTVDGTAATAGEGLPLVTAYVPGDGMDGTGGPFEPLLDGDAADLHAGLPHPIEDEMIGMPLDDDAPGIVNVETAVIDAVRAYGVGGHEALANDSAACWRTMRDEPSARALQYCHVFDLVAAAVIDPIHPGEFAEFAVEVRLRAHRPMVTGEVPADYASAWRDEATMVVAAMGGH